MEGNHAVGSCRRVDKARGEVRTPKKEGAHKGRKSAGGRNAIYMRIKDRRRRKAEQAR